MINDILKYIKQGFSYSEVAKKLGVTKGVVAGRIRRSGNKGLARIPLEKKRVSKVSKIAIDGSDFIGVSIIDIKEHQCRFPNNDKRFCGKPVCKDNNFPFRDYCKDHYNIMRSPKNGK